MAAVRACPGSSHQLPAVWCLSLGQEKVPEEEGGGRLVWAT